MPPVRFSPVGRSAPCKVGSRAGQRVVAPASGSIGDRILARRHGSGLPVERRAPVGPGAESGEAHPRPGSDPIPTSHLVEQDGQCRRRRVPVPGDVDGHLGVVEAELARDGVDDSGVGLVAITRSMSSTPMPALAAASRIAAGISDTASLNSFRPCIVGRWRSASSCAESTYGRCLNPTPGTMMRSKAEPSVCNANVRKPAPEEPAFSTTTAPAPSPNRTLQSRKSPARRRSASLGRSALSPRR